MKLISKTGKKFILTCKEERKDIGQLIKVIFSKEIIEEYKRWSLIKHLIISCLLTVPMIIIPYLFYHLFFMRGELLEAFASLNSYILALIIVLLLEAVINNVVSNLLKLKRIKLWVYLIIVFSFGLSSYISLFQRLPKQS